MKRIVFLSIVTFLFLTPTFSQDIIVTKEGTEIESKVTEITTEVIKYKKWEQLDGPVRNILLSEVFMIIYEDGTREIISTEKAKPEEKEESPIKEPTKLGKTNFGVGAQIEFGYTPYFSGGLILRLFDIITLNVNYAYDGKLDGYDNFGFKEVNSYIVQLVGGTDIALMERRNLQFHGEFGYFWQPTDILLNNNLGEEWHHGSDVAQTLFNGFIVGLGLNYQFNKYVSVINRLSYKIAHFTTSTVHFVNEVTGERIIYQISGYNGFGISVGMIFQLPIAYKEVNN